MLSQNLPTSSNASHAIRSSNDQQRLVLQTFLSSSSVGHVHDLNRRNILPFHRKPDCAPNIAIPVTGETSANERQHGTSENGRRWFRRIDQGSASDDGETPVH